MVAPARPCRVGSEAKPSATIEALRCHVGRYLARYGLDPVRMHVLNRLLACRTPTMGTHTCVCEACGWSARVCNSCRDRHCPRCQGAATAEWLEARLERMLPVPHFQVVFTLPSELRPIAYDNPKLVHGLLMRTAAGVLQALAAQRMDARLGITTVLHTWTSELSFHPHAHCLVSAGGLSLDTERWVPTRKDYLFPQRILGAMFRGRFLEGLFEAHDAGDLQLRGETVQASKDFCSTTRKLAKRHARWVVHVEPPRGRGVELVTKYLARYVKRIAISDARVVNVTDTGVIIQTRKGPLVLDGVEFVRRFLLHVLPSGFRKVRHYGLYAPGNAKRRLEIARALLEEHSADTAEVEPEDQATDEPEPKASTGEVCPECGEQRVVRIFPTPRRVRRARGPP